LIGTVSGNIRSIVIDLGADSFVDLDQERLEYAVGQIDVVFDTIGGDVLARSPAVVKPGGALVSVAMPPPADREDIRTVFFIREGSKAQLLEIARLVDSDQLRPQLGAVYPLADAREAFTTKSTRSMPGKVVLQP